VQLGYHGIMDGATTHDATQPRLEDLDVVVMVQLAATFLGAEVRRRLAQAGFGSLRDSHGYLMQHLVRGPIVITDLAGRLSISQQAVSKSAAELEAGGYLARRSVAGDRRARALVLTDRGLRMVEVTRAIRADLAAELADTLGSADLDITRRVLHGLLRHLGASERIAGRAVPASS